MKLGGRQIFALIALMIMGGNGFIGYAIYRSNQKMQEAAQRVEHTEDVIYNSGNILALAKDVETASRGFVITNNSTYVIPLYTAKQKSLIYLAQLRKLTQDNPSQQQQIDSLGIYIEKQLEYSFQVVQARRNEGLQSAIAFVSSNQGKFYTDNIVTITKSIQQQENKLLKERNQANKITISKFNRFSIVIFGLMTIFNILLLIAIGNYILQVREKAKRAAELGIANEELIFQGKEKERRAAELILANIELVFQTEEKEKRADELVIANKELVIQNREKEKRAEELIIAYKELRFQNEEKERRAAELMVANKELESLEHEQTQREARLKDAQSIAHIGSWEIDINTNIQSWSDELFNIFGTNVEETYPSIESYLSFIHPDDKALVFDKLDGVLRDSPDSSYDFRFHRKDGTARYGYAKVHFEFDEDHKPRKRHGIVQDITEKRQADNKLKKANRLYTFISQVNQNIVHVKDQASLFRNLCNIAIGVGKFKIAWVGMVDAPGGKMVMADQSGIPADYINKFNHASLATDAPQRNVIGTNKYFISNEIVSDPELESWKTLAFEQKIRSCMILPIKKFDHVVGTLNLYATESDFFDIDEIILLEEVAGDISFAIEVFENTRRQKETEVLVGENEKRFRAMIEKSTDLIALRNPEGKITYVSPSIAKTLGYSKQEILNLPVFDLIHPDDIPILQKQTQVILKTPGDSFFCQQRYFHKDGSLIWCEGTVTNMMHEPGVMALVSNFKNITEKKIAEEQLEFDRNNLYALINNTEDLMWSLDKDSKIITSNHAFDTMVKTMSGTIVSMGSNLGTQFGDDQQEQFKGYFKRAMAGETFKEIVHTKLPVELWSEVSYYPMYNDEEVVGTACFSRNITNQRKSESRLRLLESVITNSNDAVLITLAQHEDSAEHAIIYVNNAFTKMTGYTSQEVMGATPSLLQGPNTDRHQLDAIRKSMSAGESIEVEVINYKKNKEEFWNNFTIVPVTLNDGNLTYWVSIQRDVTSRRRSEEITRTRLEKLVEERTRELNDALKKEKILVELKSKFVSIASHEFRTPLSTISFAAESIRNYFHQLTSEEIQRKLIKIEDQASHMTNMLEDILTLGKSDAGKIKVKRISLNLKDFVDSLIEEVKATSKEKRVINFVFSCTNPNVNTDDKLLRNVINNLLTNALKFSPANTPVTITISDNAECIFIEVTDQGIGIDESEQVSIFESFQRGSNVSTIQGSGLGLSILKRAVDLMDGTIELKSELNKGSSFKIRISRQ